MVKSSGKLFSVIEAAPHSENNDESAEIQQDKEMFLGVSMSQVRALKKEKVLVNFVEF